MKKVILALALVGLIVAPTLVLAQNPAPTGCKIKVADPIPNCPGDCAVVGGSCLYEDVDAVSGVTGAECCLFSTIHGIINWVFMALMIIVTILVLIGAFSLVTSGGDETKVAKGRNYIIFALVGLAIALFSRALPMLIKSILGQV